MKEQLVIGWVTAVGTGGGSAAAELQRAETASERGGDWLPAEGAGKEGVEGDDTDETWGEVQCS